MEKITSISSQYFSLREEFLNELNNQISKTLTPVEIRKIREVLK